MAATLHRLRTRKARLQAEQAAQLRQHILAFDEFALPEEAVRQVISAIDKQTAASNGWTFVMLSPAQNRAVVRWLGKHSARPSVAVQLWAEILTTLRIDTGEVMATREELAERVETRPSQVSEVLSELEAIGAITRRRERVPGMRGPGRVTICVSPLVATHLAGATRDRAQQAAAPINVEAPEAKTRTTPPPRRPRLVTG